MIPGTACVTFLIMVSCGIIVYVYGNKFKHLYFALVMQMIHTEQMTRTACVRETVMVVSCDVYNK